MRTVILCVMSIQRATGSRSSHAEPNIQLLCTSAKLNDHQVIPNSLIVCLFFSSLWTLLTKDGFHLKCKIQNLRGQFHSKTFSWYCVYMSWNIPKKDYEMPEDLRIGFSQREESQKGVICKEVDHMVSYSLIRVFTVPVSIVFPCFSSLN